MSPEYRLEKLLSALKTSWPKVMHLIDRTLILLCGGGCSPAKHKPQILTVLPFDWPNLINPTQVASLRVKPGAIHERRALSTFGVTKLVSAPITMNR